jgi:hypothetical protein
MTLCLAIFNGAAGADFTCNSTCNLFVGVVHHEYLWHIDYSLLQSNITGFTAQSGTSQHGLAYAFPCGEVLESSCVTVLHL